MMPAPAISTMSGRLRATSAPSSPTVTPSAVNTTVKPATNSTADRRVTDRASLRPSLDTGSPEMYET